MTKSLSGLSVAAFAIATALLAESGPIMMPASSCSMSRRVSTRAVRRVVAAAVPDDLEVGARDRAAVHPGGGLPRGRPA